MGKGKASGLDREYQVQCRDVLTFRAAELSPWQGDGVDIPFPFAGTTYTLDVALRGDGGRLVVAECRRTQDPVQQEAMAAFAYKVEQLRKELNIDVAGVFFTKAGATAAGKSKTPFQIGAVNAGDFEGIALAVLAETDSPPAFSMSFHRYDREREQRCIDCISHVPVAHAVVPEAVFVRFMAQQGIDVSADFKKPE